MRVLENEAFHLFSRLRMSRLTTKKPTRAQGVMSAKALMERQYETYGLFGEAKTLLGDPEVGFSALLYGPPGQGKSSLAIRLARYFAQYHGPVCYVSSEQFDSFSLQENLRRAGGAVDDMDFLKALPTDAELRHYAVLFIDSVQNIGLTLAEFKRLVARTKGRLAIILVQQVAKNGNYRGSQEWAHEVDVEVKLEEGRANAVKNRFAPLSSIVVFRNPNPSPAAPAKKRR